MAAVIEYKGFQITYGENSDDWSCWDLEFYGGKTATAIKNKIDLHLRKSRKKAELVPVYRISHDGKISRVHVSTLCEKPRDPRPGYREYDREYGKAWVIQQADEKSKRQRSKERINDLVPDNPVNVAMLQEFKRRYDAAVAAKKDADDYARSIPRFTYDQLAATGATENDEA